MSYPLQVFALVPLAEGLGAPRLTAAAEEQDEEPDEEDQWDALEPAEPESEPPWEVWDPLDDEPPEPAPGDFWPDLPDDED